MKQAINLTEYPLTPIGQQFIQLWKEKKGYTQSPHLTLGQCIELVIATTYSLHKEYSDGRFFNNILINQESVIAWDGQELIDTLFYQIMQNISRRVAASRTFNENSLGS